MHGEGFFIVALIGTICFALVTIIRSSLQHIRVIKSERMQVEMFNKLMDKLGSSQEALQYLQQNGGLNLLKIQEMPLDKPRSPHGRILNSIQIGIVSAVLGGGVLSLQSRFTNPYDSEPPAVIGTILLALGVGFLLAGGASWVMSRSMGLLNGTSRNEQA